MTTLAHLVSHPPMSTRKCAHTVRHQAKPSMPLSAELQKLFENMANQVLNLEYISMEPLAFYARLKAHMKSSRNIMERQSGAPYFL
jgi:hypothetical protein